MLEDKFSFRPSLKRPLPLLTGTVTREPRLPANGFLPLAHW